MGGQFDGNGSESKRVSPRASMSFSAAEVSCLVSALASIGPRDWAALREISDDPALAGLVEKALKMQTRLSAAGLLETPMSARAQANALREEYRRLTEYGCTDGDAIAKICESHGITTKRAMKALRPVRFVRGSVVDSAEEAAE